MRALCALGRREDPPPVLKALCIWGLIVLFKIKRAFAFGVDIALALLLGFIILASLFYCLGMLGISFNINLTKYSHLIGAMAYSIGYVLLNTRSLYKHDASLGKRIVGLKVLGASSLSAKLARTLIPILGLYLNMWLACIALISFLLGLGPKNLAGHDYLFRTQVVNA